MSTELFPLDVNMDIKGGNNLRKAVRFSDRAIVLILKALEIYIDSLSQFISDFINDEDFDDKKKLQYEFYTEELKFAGQIRNFLKERL